MDFKIKPWEHQIQVLKRTLGKPYFALFMDTGTGKTATAIHILRQEMNARRQFIKTLVFAPQIVVPNWENEIERHSNIGRDRVCLLGTGSAKKRQDTFQKYVERFPDGFICVLNYEAALMPGLYLSIQRWQAGAIVLDESSRVKNHSAQRSKLIDALANPYDKKTKQYLPKPLTYILTGTPILNSAEDIFMQYKILDGGRTFGENYHVFKRTYFSNRNAGAPSHVTWPKWEIKTLAKDGMDATATISHKISQTSFHIKKEQCLDLPPLVRQRIHIELGPEQRKHYEEMKRDFVTYTESSACVATLAITKALRLSQIASGYLPVIGKDLEAGAAHIFKENPRLNALEELLSDLTPNHKVLVWAVWQENYKQIRSLLERMKIRYVEVHGGVSGTKKQEAVDDFNNNPDTRVFLGNPGAGGIGINLIPASYSIFYSRNTSLEQSLQAEARNYRAGSNVHKKITRIDLVCGGTVDELICDSLERKEALSLEILKKSLAKI